MSRAAHLALSIATFAAVFIAGRFAFAVRHAAHQAPSAADVRRQDTPTNTGALPPAGIQRTAHAGAEEELLTAIMSAVAEEEPLLRAHRLHELLAHLDSKELAALFERAVRVEDGERRAALLAAVLSRWVAHDPVAAAAAVLPYRERLRKLTRIRWGSVDTMVSAAWAQAQPEAVFREVMADPDAPWAQAAAWSAMDTLAGGDPSRQLEMLAQLPYGRTRSQMCEQAIKALAKKDPAAAEARLDLLTEPRQRGRLQAEILGQLTVQDPAAGLARLAALAPDLTAGSDSQQILMKVLGNAAKKDLPAALAALDTIPQELFTSAAGYVLANWAGEHPVDALEWAGAHGINIAETTVLEQSFDDGSQTYNALIGKAVGGDREKTVAWILAQPASRERDALLKLTLWNGTPEQRLAVFDELSPDARADATQSMIYAFQGDVPAAQAWVESLPNGTVRNAAIGRLVELQLQYAPERADTLADAWPAGPERDSALGNLVLDVSYNNPNQALDFARRIADATQREIAFERAARGWLSRDENAARAWLSSTPDLTPGVKQVLLREFDQR